MQEPTIVEETPDVAVTAGSSMSWDQRLVKRKKRLAQKAARKKNR